MDKYQASAHESEILPNRLWLAEFEGFLRADIVLMLAFIPTQALMWTLSPG